MTTNNPFRGFIDTMSETNRMRQEWMREGPSPGEIQQRGSSQKDAWTPLVEVIAEESNLVIFVDLPGVGPEDIELAFSGGLLTISGQRTERQRNGERYSQERPLGIFRRGLTFPSSVSEGNIKTHLEDGVLEITVEDYARLSEPRRIQVQEGRGSR